MKFSNYIRNQTKEYIFHWFLDFEKDFFIIWELFGFLLRMKLYEILHSEVLVSE
jgi:hypothetical protein